ncbi:HNH endonuclease [Brevibacterium sp. p3-SID960]|uniref:HNH endonuclease signature motif containing protein n=1 Tax=Brevibacterium sp. p3-SID960 TaxID=2916063 RepID=UPI0021A94A80|nr:HNH endonuclease signature motif containing protein [Brevibacterium sp. p3-SID960]MCT1689602.1 HNH endonuclease [Brevibacterium sp. p3-SID960]
MRGDLDVRLNRLHASRVAQGLLKVHEYEDALASYSARLDREPEYRELSCIVDEWIKYRPARFRHLPPASTSSETIEWTVPCTEEQLREPGSEPRDHVTFVFDPSVIHRIEADLSWDRGLPDLSDPDSIHSTLVHQGIDIGLRRKDAVRPRAIIGHSAHGTFSRLGAVGADDRKRGKRSATSEFRPIADGVSAQLAERMAVSLAQVEDTFTSELLLSLTELYDCTTQTAASKIKRAARAILGTPRLLSMVRAGELSFDRLEYAVRAAGKLPARKMPIFDEKISQCRATKMVYFRRAVNELIAALMTDDERNEEAFSRRRVVTHHNANGTSEMTLIGPTHSLVLLEARLAGMAKAIRRGQLSAFGEQLPDGHIPVEDRTLEQLKFDLLAGAILATESECAPADEVGAESIPGVEPDRTRVRFTCPTDTEWLRRQARVNVTVPMMTLLNEDADIPGTLNGIPINPDAARHIVGSGPKTVYRILTDPETGKVRDAQAQTYTIPEAMRIALVEKWQYCTAPGCHQPARKAELDHQRPFDHRHPAAGGLTTMKNLHPLCKMHHQLKTQGALRLSSCGSSEMICWEMDGRTCDPVTIPESLLGVLNAEHFAAMAEGRLPNPSPEPVLRIPDRSGGDDDPDDSAEAATARTHRPAGCISADDPAHPSQTRTVFDNLRGEPSGGWENSADPPPF